MITAHFELSEEQELRMYRVRHIMTLLNDMACAVPPGKQITFDPESLSCLLSTMTELLPQDNEMRYQIHS